MNRQPRSDAQRAAVSAALKKAWADPTRRAMRTKNIRKSVREAMKDPDKRANLVAAVKRGGVTRTTPMQERFWSYVDKNGPKQPHMKTRCWLWLGTKQTIAQRRVDHRIYGLIAKPGKYGGNMLVHRYAFKLQVGPLRKKRQVQHKCDVALCVRGSHLKQGTQQENSDDMRKRGRFSEKRPGSRGGNFYVTRNGTIKYRTKP